VTDSFRGVLRLDPELAHPTSLRTDTTPGFVKGKKKGRKAIAKLRPELVDLQERLYASARGGAGRSILLVLQGMDTSGKGGVIEHVTGSVNPQGLSIASFKQPTAEEQQHDFLWRVRRRLPESGQIAVFDRSYYEDVVVVRVHELAPRTTWAARFDSINNFEADLAERGVTVIKCFLHISPEEQRKRLLARIDDPTKCWKYNPQDVDERGYWAHYAAAYDDALTRCNTESAPWYVIPADHKWYRDLAISRLLLEHLRELDPAFPEASFDPAEERRRLASTPVVAAGPDDLQVRRTGKAAQKKAARKKAAPKKAAHKNAEPGRKKSDSAGGRGRKTAARKTAAGKAGTRQAGAARGTRTLAASRSRGRRTGQKQRRSS
jgi:PPK2 family polyphosphate:nucleotide phosphotransferase